MYQMIGIASPGATEPAPIETSTAALEPEAKKLADLAVGKDSHATLQGLLPDSSLLSYLIFALCCGVCALPSLSPQLLMCAVVAQAQVCLPVLCGLEPGSQTCG